MKKHTTLITALFALYFAYGSNMDLLQMEDRCPAGVTVGTAQLPSYRFMINSRGVATVVPDPASTVDGLLWNINEQDERSLSRHEGIKKGIYKKVDVVVLRPDGTRTQAFIYVAADSKKGKARPGYLDKIISGAEGCGLPQSYIDQLKSWQR